MKLQKTDLKGTKLAQNSHKLPSKFSNSVDENAHSSTNTHKRTLW